MNTTTKISQDFAAVSTAGKAANGNRILCMTDAAKPYYWNGSDGRRATEAEVREAGF